MVELVIKIPEEVYNRFKNLNQIIGILAFEKDTLALIKAVKKGTLLPKGHGRLIDENQLIEEIRDDIVGNFDNLEYWLSAADTVIEADKAESEG